jgi:hypothetical protein
MYYHYNDYEKNIIRDIKRMTDESKQLERIMHQDDLDLEKIEKMKKLQKNKRKKDEFLNKNNNNKKLPELINNNTNEEKTKEIPYNTLSKFEYKPIKTFTSHFNNNLTLATDYSNKNSYREPNFCLNNPILEKQFKRKIEKLDEYNNILNKINETYKKLPFYYKKLDKKFQYNNGQIIFDESLTNRYNKKDDISLNINTIKNKILSPELNMTFHPNFTKDYFFKKSLMFNNKNLKIFYTNKYNKNNTFLSNNKKDYLKFK